MHSPHLTTPTHGRAHALHDCTGNVDVATHSKNAALSFAPSGVGKNTTSPSWIGMANTRAQNDNKTILKNIKRTLQGAGLRGIISQPAQTLELLRNLARAPRTGL